MSKPVIIVRYWKDEPTVIVPEGLDVEVKLVDALEEDSLVIAHNGVRVYQTIKDDMGDSFMYSDYWHATHPGMGHEDDEAFDIRDVPAVPEEKETEYEAKTKSDEPEHWALAYAIDQGWLTDDGYSPSDDKDKK